jgi:hypothetical protein
MNGVEKTTLPVAASFGNFLMDVLRDPNIPADKLEVVLKARQENLKAEANEAFQLAFVKFHAECPQVERDGMVDLGPGKGRYPFTTIEAMDVILRPLLAKHGLAIWFQSEEIGKDAVKVVGHLEGWGTERTSTRTHPADTGPGRNAQQALGSASRYAKRYVVDDLCDIVRKGKDNDGRGAIDQIIDATQVAALRKLIKETTTDEAAFLKLMVSGAESLSDIRERDYTRLEMALREKQARKRK